MPNRKDHPKDHFDGLRKELAFTSLPSERSVVKATLGNLKPLLIPLPANPINQPILDCDSARPPAFEVTL